MELELPYPPCVNHYKRPGRLIKTKTGKVFQARVNTDETNKYFFTVATIIHRKIRVEGLLPFKDALLEVCVTLFPPDRRKRDIDGPLKVLLDSLQKGGLYDDDFQICKLTVERKEMVAGGKVIVRLREISS